MAELIAFFEARRGQLYGFRWRDWADFKSCPPSQIPASGDQLIGTGDGATAVFPLAKTYISGGDEYVRPITKPVAGSVQIEVAGTVLVEGTDYAVEATTGAVTLNHPPAADQEVRAGFVFDVPARFDTDRIHVSASSFNAGQIPNVPVVEVRV